MINIDFLLSGCNTRCRHCYVNGGPGRMMTAEDALICIERLDMLASLLPGEISLTLDHEPMNHPGIAEILRAAAGTRCIQNHHHGMTTGIALMSRRDRDEVMKAYMDCGYSTFGITLHGASTVHDEIVRRKGAHRAAVEAAEYARAFGAGVEVSLMMNRHFPSDADTITHVLERIEADYTGLVLPIFTPHRNMMDFEGHRASLKDVLALEGVLEKWGLDKAGCLENALQSTVSHGIERLKNGPDLPAMFEQPQDEMYLTLHQDCMLYVGNSGAETYCMGDLRGIDLDEAAQTIARLPGNRDYTAFYDVDALPTKEKLINALEQLPGETIFGDFESVVYRGLHELGIPTRIIDT